MDNKQDYAPPQYTPAPGNVNMGYQPPPPGADFGQQPPQGAYMMQQPPAGGHMVQPQCVAQQPQYVAQQVQYMVQQPTTVTVQQQPVTLARPDDCLGCSIFTCLFCNAFFLGLIALICACQSKSSADANNIELARQQGRHARNLNIAAIVLTIFTVPVIVLIWYFTVYAVVSNQYCLINPCESGCPYNPACRG